MIAHAMSRLREDGGNMTARAQLTAARNVARNTLARECWQPKILLLSMGNARG